MGEGAKRRGTTQREIAADIVTLGEAEWEGTNQ